MAKKNAKGGGTIRKKTVTRSGKEYTYWEARVTVGRDPGTGKQIQRSFTGKTQKEVREKMQAAAVAVTEGTYTEPSRLTVGQWFDIWIRDYLGSNKPSTVSAYQRNIKNYIKPNLGAVKLSELHPHMVQSFINSLKLAPATVRLAFGILHCGLEKAVELQYIPRNPTVGCVLPKKEQREVHPFSDDQAAAFLKAARGSNMELLFTVALFTGMRLSELLGLTWDAVNAAKGVIVIDKQLTRHELREHGLFATPKSGKARTITPAASVFGVLKRQKVAQLEAQFKAGELWDNPHNLVFTTATGGPVESWSADRAFKATLAAAGLSGFHFHDLRHTYAVNAIRAGDDIKTVQTALGHASAAFTLDVYGHVTETMMQDSATRMERFIKDVMNL